MKITINQDRCTDCGICGDVCPRHIPVTTENGDKKITTISSERIGLCMECVQCVSLCPHSAIEVGSLNHDKYARIDPHDIDEGQLLSLMKQRRSIRNYKDKLVPRQIINRMVDAAHSAPTGTGRSTTGVIVIDNRNILSGFSELIYELYEELEKNLTNPIVRYFVKRKVGEKRFRTLREFVMPGMHWYIRWFRDGKSNEILRDCPALMLFHSPINEPVGVENCLIAAFHSIMMAQILGIGTCFNDIIPPACNKVTKIRKLLDLPNDREVYASITLGYPKYSFKRITPRKLAEVRYLEE